MKVFQRALTLPKIHRKGGWWGAEATEKNWGHPNVPRVQRHGEQQGVSDKGPRVPRKGAVSNRKGLGPRGGHKKPVQHRRKSVTEHLIAVYKLCTLSYAAPELATKFHIRTGASSCIPQLRDCLCAKDIQTRHRTGIYSQQILAHSCVMLGTGYFKSNKSVCSQRAHSLVGAEEANELSTHHGPDTILDTSNKAESAGAAQPPGVHTSIQVGTGDEAAQRRTGTPPPQPRELSEEKVNWKEILEGCVQKDEKMESIPAEAREGALGRKQGWRERLG